ncbi:ubiquitin carboxyl-terminal hydrolase 18 [Malania oleifera]|uniref:ubiquitin carboxyl-terminal hydrolase 18 n=1 Tax=Malania oleifera TaxID=397392 RepID=UPI0025ADA2BB|nr:ubiquitin carboxyl-terminal hydrolase 18 [Malania oleifera]
MHVSGVSLDLNWFLQFIFTAFVIALVLLHLAKKTASKYFEVDASFESGGDGVVSGDQTNQMPGVSRSGDACVACGNSAKKCCSGCKVVRYCSQSCQVQHWGSGHKTKCKKFQLAGKVNLMESASNHGKTFFGGGGNISLVPASGTTKIFKQPKKILFPYDEFVELFNWDKLGCPPCGLLNCGNSCFANVVLQCLAFTRPLVAYLLEKGHRRECRRNDWCFLCEFQMHVERASRSLQPFSPLNILSRLPNIGGNFRYGKQEDAHEFMRFAIDTMQSLCLDEFGGEKALHPCSQETTLIQHIFGGHLQSQVICMECNKISNQYESMMDLTVEIQGDAASLEDCLDQFTVREWLHGENMYKCDGCNDYVKASKRLTVRRAPNILTFALKRFQSGRFGKLNKRISFPETLDLTPYMSEAGDGTDVYKLYAVVVHVDMLNASFFGHYICYVKDFRGNWYKIDDDKVRIVELEEVLSQGAYMLLYSRVCARSSCLNTIGSFTSENQITEVAQEVEPHSKQLAECFTTSEPSRNCSFSVLVPSNSSIHVKVPSCEVNSEAQEKNPGAVDVINSSSGLIVSKDTEMDANGNCNAEDIAVVDQAHRLSNLASSSKTSCAEDQNLMLELHTNFGESSAREGASCIATQIPLCEDGEMSCDVPVAALSSAEKPVLEADPLSSKGLPLLAVENLEQVKCGAVLPTSDISIKDAGGKFDGESSFSGVKLKPLFSRGFLEKRHEHKSARRDCHAPGENGDLGSKLNTSCNGFAKPAFNHQIMDQAVAYSDCNGFSSRTYTMEQPDKSVNKDDDVSGDFVESIDLRNGNANASTSHGQLSEDYLSHSGSPGSVVMPVAQQSLIGHGCDCEMGSPAPSQRSGRKLKTL